jgi:hypothetical protein
MVKTKPTFSSQKIEDEEPFDSFEDTVTPNSTCKLSDDELYALLELKYPHVERGNYTDSYQYIRDIFQKREQISPSIQSAWIQYIPLESSNEEYFRAHVICYDSNNIPYELYDIPTNYYKSFYDKRDAIEWLHAFGIVYWHDMCPKEVNVTSVVSTNSMDTCSKQKKYQPPNHVTGVKNVETRVVPPPIENQVQGLNCTIIGEDPTPKTTSKYRPPVKISTRVVQ